MRRPAHQEPRPKCKTQLEVAASLSGQCGFVTSSDGHIYVLFFLNGYIYTPICTYTYIFSRFKNRNVHHNKTFPWITLFMNYTCLLQFIIIALLLGLGLKKNLEKSYDT